MLRISSFLTYIDRRLSIYQDFILTKALLHIAVTDIGNLHIYLQLRVTNLRMSQTSSQVQDPDWASIPFAKFSHNSSPPGSRSFVWNHVGARNDLDFIVRNVRLLDGHGSYTNRVLMKITAGAEILV